MMSTPFDGFLADLIESSVADKNTIDSLRAFVERLTHSFDGIVKHQIKSSTNGKNLHVTVDLNSPVTNPLPKVSEGGYGAWRDGQTILIVRYFGGVHRQAGLRRHLTERDFDVSIWDKLNNALGEVHYQLGPKGKTPRGDDSFYEDRNSVQLAEFVGSMLDNAEQAIEDFLRVIQDHLRVIDAPSTKNDAGRIELGNEDQNSKRQFYERYDEICERVQDELTDSGYWKKIEEEPNLVWRAIEQRRGQPEFRKILLNAYDGKCAMTGCNVESALEAAHIERYADSRVNDLRNGLLLRADIHTLFDCYLITGLLQFGIARPILPLFSTRNKDLRR